MTSTWARVWPWFAAASSGALLSLSYPPFNFGAVAWFWMAPLLLALWTEPLRPIRWYWWRGARLAFTAGITFFLINLQWLIELRRVAQSWTVGLSGWILLSAYVALYFGLWGAFAATAGRWRPRAGEPPPASPFKKAPKSPLLLPSLLALQAAFLNAAAWCGLEWLRATAFTGFGWNGLGVALHNDLILVQVADVVGVFGLSFLVVFSNVIATTTVWRFTREIGKGSLRPHLDFAVGILLVIGVFFYGLDRIKDSKKEDAVELRCLLMQMNIPIDKDWNPHNLRETLDDYLNLTEGYVMGGQFDLVIWPETAVPGRFYTPWVQEFFNSILELEDFYLMTGTEEDEPLGDESFNSAVLMRNSTENFQMYRKIHLVPFGEYLPLRGKFPPFEWFAGDMVVADFTPGDSYEPLKMEKPEIEIVPLICFEDTIGDLARRFVDEDPAPQLLVNITNDGWFFESATAEQHMTNAMFRCIELRRPMARAANTGVSCFIDETGSLYDRESSRPFERKIQDDTTGSVFTRGCLPATLKIARDQPYTFFARYGNVFSQGMGGIALLWWVVFYPFVRQRRLKSQRH